MSDELIALRKFLDGSAPLDGHWFSEKRPDVPGAFWWRHDLTAIDRAAAELATLRATITRLESERDEWRQAAEELQDRYARMMAMRDTCAAERNAEYAGQSSSFAASEAADSP